MLSFFIVQLPFSVCAVWCLFVMLKGHKTHSDRLLMWIMALLAVSFLCGSNHMAPYPDYNHLVFYDIVMQFSTIAVFPTICLYIRSLYEESRESLLSYMLFLPSILLVTASVVVTALLGVSNCSFLIQAIHNGVLVPDALNVLENAYIIMTYKAYYLVFFVSLSLSLIYVFSRLFTGKFKFKHVVSFLRGEKSSFVANVLCLFFVIYFNVNLFAFLVVCITIISYNAFRFESFNSIKVNSYCKMGMY